MIDGCNMSQMINAEAFDPLITYPNHISKVRAYVFALTAGRDNNDAFNADNFCAALSRFGVETPAPCVSMRCMNYGNTMNTMEYLKRAEKKYGKLSMKVHFKKYMK